MRGLKKTIRGYLDSLTGRHKGRLEPAIAASQIQKNGGAVIKPSIYTNLKITVHDFSTRNLIANDVNDLNLFNMPDIEAYLDALDAHYIEANIIDISGLGSNKEGLTPRLREILRNYIEKHGPFNKLDGLPGQHAEILPLNGMLHQNPDAILSDITIVTLRPKAGKVGRDAIKMNPKINKGMPNFDQGASFEACRNCSFILRDVDVATGMLYY